MGFSRWERRDGELRAWRRSGMCHDNSRRTLFPWLRARARVVTREVIEMRAWDQHLILCIVHRSECCDGLHQEGMMGAFGGEL